MLYSGRVRESVGCVNEQVLGFRKDEACGGAVRVDFSRAESYPEGEMSRLHLHHGHSHHHAKSVLAAVSGVAK
jgi:hypothetical protein